MTNRDGSLVLLEGIHKWFGDHHVLKGIDLSINPGEVLVIIGPSGSGKSTLLRTINLLEEPTEGRVYFDGVELTDIRTNLNEARTHMGMVFQQFNLFPHLTALDNITLALVKVLGMTKDDALERGREQLGHVGLAEKADAYPDRLSGGQQQRVAIARALVHEPRLIVCDEPTSSLDIATEAVVWRNVEDLLAGRTSIVIAHRLSTARRADRIAVMEDGRIIEAGSHDELVRQGGVYAQLWARHSSGADLTESDLISAKGT